MAVQNTIEEYVVKLGTVVDNEGIQKILSFFDSSRTKALGLGAALAGATAAVYKFIESATAHEFELAKLAQKQKKTLALTRAENNAMKAMGKTMAEINNDKDLKKIYKDLVEFNKEMKMPNVNSALDNVRKLEVAFAKLRSTINTAVQWINAQVLINLERPIERLTNKAGGIAGWLKENMKVYAPKIASWLSDFAMGIIGIVEAGGKLLKWINDLPPAIKEVGTAILFVIGLIKGGTIGRLLLLISLIGDIMRDYENYHWNLENPDKDPIKTANDFNKLWEAFDEAKDSGDYGLFAQKFLEVITQHLREAFQNFNMSDIFGDGTEGGEGFFGSIIKWVKGHPKTLSNFAEELVKAIVRGVRTFGGTTGGIIGTILDSLFGDVTSDFVWEDSDGSAGAALGGAFAGFVVNFAEGIKNGGSLWDSFKQGLKGATIGSILTDILANMVVDENGITIEWDKVELDLSAVGETILTTLTEAVKTAGDYGQAIMDGIGGGLTSLNLDGENGPLSEFTEKIGGVFQDWAKDGSLMDGITAGITVGLSGGSLLESIFAGLFGSFTGSKDEARDEMRNYLKDKAFIPWDEILSYDDETLEKAFLEAGGEGSLLTKTFSHMGEDAGKMIEGLWETLLAGINLAGDVGGKLFELLVNKIVELLTSGAEGGKLENAGEGLGDNSFSKIIGTTIGTKLAGGDFLLSLLTGLTAGIEDMMEKVGDDETLWDVVQREAADFAEKFTYIWNGAIDPETGKSKNNGLKNVFEHLFDTSDDTSFLSVVLTWLEPIGQAISSFFSSLWDTIISSLSNSLEKAYRDFYNKNIRGTLADEFLIADPNKSKVEGNDEEGYSLTSTTDLSVDGIPKEIADRLNILAPILSLYDDNGKQKMKFTGAAEKYGKEGEYHDALPRNMYLTNELYDVLNKGTPEDIKRYMNTLDKFINTAIERGYIKEPGEEEEPKEEPSAEQPDNKETKGAEEDFANGLETLTESADETTDSVDGAGEALEDLTDKTEKMEREAENASDHFRGAGDAAGDLEEANDSLKANVDTAAANALNAAEQFDFAAQKAAEAAGRLASIGTEKAWGGRIGSEGVYTVGEDGPEYIIPVTKPKRALDLINRALSEMGMSTLDRISNDFGVGSSASFGTLGKSLESLIGGIGGNTNISAPINIYVTATGADGKEIGAGAYNAAERHLMKTLREVVA